MTTRKPLDPKCNGSITCTVEKHVVVRSSSRGTTITHVRLTQGQRRTLGERQNIHRARNAAD
jgi:hypothetical protein